jgi:hypothetical protein
MRQRRYIAIPAREKMSERAFPYAFRIEPSHDADGNAKFELHSRDKLVEEAFIWARDQFGEPKVSAAWFYDERTDMMYFREYHNAIEFKLRWC